MKTCTCPHDPAGGERVMLDQNCPVHSVPPVVSPPRCTCGRPDCGGFECARNNP